MPPANAASRGASEHHAPSSERRSEVRYPPHPDAGCRFFTSLGGPSAAAQIRDISARGVGLLLPHPLQPGDILTTDFTNPLVHFARIKWLRVIHATRAPSDSWLVGCSFEESLRDRELLALRAPEGSAPVRLRQDSPGC